MSQEAINAMSRILDIHQASDGMVRPHFVLTGPSGSGKTHTVQTLCEDKDIPFFEINCAQLTKEGYSGNSLSKELAVLQGSQLSPVVVLMDEFDKLFLTNNVNDGRVPETAIGVQNEILKVLESPVTKTFGDYGKFNETPVQHVLFIFAGAFNNEENVDMDRLRELGVKTEFLGRAGLCFNLEKVSLDNLLGFLDNSDLFDRYVALNKDVNVKAAKKEISDAVKQNYPNNTLGIRMLNTLIHQYFIYGTLKKKAAAVTFQRQLSMPVPDNDLFRDA